VVLLLPRLRPQGVDIQKVVALAPLLMAQAVVAAMATHNVVISPTSRVAVPPAALPPGPNARFAPRLTTPSKHASTAMMMIQTSSHTQWV
jgi:hypothetical protein